MPKLPHISGKECVGILERMGFAQVRQKGSHVIMRRGERGCVVPMHREIKVGTLAGLLRQAGVEPDHFIQVRNG
jgi:predicted RNA binding protein YcfA (HicA-like mRNA interferase family)